MKRTLVEGYMYVPYKAVVEGIDKEGFDSLSEEEQAKMINTSKDFKSLGGSHGGKILFTYDEK